MTPSPRLRRLAKPVLGAFLVAAVAAGGVVVMGDRFVRQDPQVCGSCHAMQTPLRLWTESAHHDISCQTCHRLGRLDGLRMLWGVASGRLGPGHANVESSVCFECHASTDRDWRLHAETPVHRQHLQRDPPNCLMCHAVSTHKVRPTSASCDACHPARAPKPRPNQ